jgi:PhzF family phenazine biosynthesis protein
VFLFEIYMLRRFKQLDVFTGIAFYGNGLAVVLDGARLTDEQMQRFAAWTQLSETTFVSLPTHRDADYAVRIFTPGGELPFAGHPTLGTATAWLAAGGKPKQKGRVVQECQVGLIPIVQLDKGLAFAAPASTRSLIDAAKLAELCAVLGVKTEQVKASQGMNNGSLWYGLLLDSTETVLGLQPDFAAMAKMDAKVGVIASYPEGSPVDVEVRGFVPSLNVNEDPVTGSLNALLAQWLIGDGLLPKTYSAAQGQRVNRAGRLSLSQDDAGQVWVGGESVMCIEGWVKI